LKIINQGISLRSNLLKKLHQEKGDKKQIPQNVLKTAEKIHTSPKAEECLETSQFKRSKVD